MVGVWTVSLSVTFGTYVVSQGIVSLLANAAQRVYLFGIGIIELILVLVFRDGAISCGWRRDLLTGLGS